MKVEKNNGVTLYLQIKILIEKKILNGDFKINDKLPSERNLANTLKVNRLMVRKALAQLCNDGVLEVKKNTGYFVKSITPILKNKILDKQGLIGFIVPYLINKYYFSFFEGINSKLYENNMLAILGDSREEQIIEEELIINFIKKGVDGIILFPYKDNIDNDYIKYLNKFGIPYVLSHCNNNLNAPMVNIDNKKVGVEATSYLIKNKYNKIAFISEYEITKKYFLQERFKGYKKTLKKANIQFDESLLFQNFNIQNETDVKNLLQTLKEKNIKGLFCATDREAKYLYYYLLNDKNRGTYNPIIVGVNNIGYKRLVGDVELNFPSVQIDSKTIGTKLAELLINQITSNKKIYTKELIDVTLKF